MSIKSALIGLGLVASRSLAAPAPASPSDIANVSSDAPPHVSEYPWGLPSTFPEPSVRMLSQGTPTIGVPTHFGLFGYSYDGTIVNQSYFADGQPYNKDFWGFLTRPGLDLGNQTYGSYAFGIGRGSGLFAYDDGRIATFNDNDGEALDTVLFESWKDWWDYKDGGEPADKIPACEIIPFYDVLYCTLNGTGLQFAWCDDTVPYGIGYSKDTVNWGTDVSPCTAIALQAVEVPKGYGDTYPAEACAKGEFPGLAACETNGTKTNGTASTNSARKVR